MRDFVRLTRRFLDYTVGRNRRIVWICIVLVAGGYIGKAGVAWMLKDLTDALVAGDRTAAMWALAILVPLLILSVVEENSLIDYVAIHQYYNAAHGFDRHLMSVDLSLPRVDHLEDPTYLDRYQLLQGDTEDLVKVLWTWLRILAASVQTLISVVLLIRVHPVLALFPLAVAPVLAADAKGASLFDRARRAAAPDDRLEGALHTILTGPLTAKEVKVARADAEIDRVAADAWDRSSSVQVRSAVRAQLIAFAAWLVFGAVQVGVAAGVAMRVIRGDAELGDVILVITLGLQSRAQLGTFVWNASRGRRTSIAFRRYRELIRIHDERTAPIADPRPVPDRISDGICLEAVEFLYPGADRPSLSDVTLRLPAGTTLAVSR